MSSQTITVAEHIQELRTRLMWTILFLVIGAVFGYFINETLISLLQRPLQDTLYYTTPGGAFSFIIKVCTVFGLIIALPMAIYQAFAYVGPLIKVKTKRSFVGFVVASFLLAVSGILFAYYVSLPAALHFLVNFGASSDIESLITANEYFNFVLTYIAGFAVLFQVPLIVLLADAVKPTPPSQLLRAFRYVVLASFVMAAILTPTPDPFNQAIMAGPVIALYLIAVMIVAVRSGVRKKSAKRPVAQQTNKVNVEIPKDTEPKFVLPKDFDITPNKKSARRSTQHMRTFKPYQNTVTVQSPSNTELVPEQNKPLASPLPQPQIISDFIVNS